jgi:hypothetical protein
MEKFNPESNELDPNKYRDNLAKKLKKIESHEDRKEVLDNIKESSDNYKNSKENKSDINIIYDELMSDDTKYCGVVHHDGPIEKNDNGETRESQILKVKINGVDVIAKRSLLVEDNDGYKKPFHTEDYNYEYSLVVESSSGARKETTKEKAIKIAKLIFDRNPDFGRERTVASIEVDDTELNIKTKKVNNKLDGLDL